MMIIIPNYGTINLIFTAPLFDKVVQELDETDSNERNLLSSNDESTRFASKQTEIISPNPKDYVLNFPNSFFLSFSCYFGSS